MRGTEIYVVTLAKKKKRNEMASRYRSRESTGSSQCSPQEDESKEDKEDEKKSQKGGLIQGIKKLWAKTGLDLPTVLLMMK